MAHPEYKLIEPLSKPDGLIETLETAEYWRSKGVHCVIRLAGMARYTVWSAVKKSQEAPDALAADGAGTGPGGASQATQGS